jgi:hypothetical protein
VRVRFALAAALTLGYLLTGVFGRLSMTKNPNKTFKEFKKWEAHEQGYAEHVTSAIFEWLVALALSLYSLTFTSEFKVISFKMPEVQPRYVEASGDDDSSLVLLRNEVDLEAGRGLDLDMTQRL